MVLKIGMVKESKKGSVFSFFQEKGCLLTKGATVTKLGQLFTKNTSLYKVVRLCIGADACPMSKGQGNW